MNVDNRIELSSRLLKVKPVISENSPLCQPIYQTSVFRMPSYEEAVRCENATHPISYYSRWGNPTVRFLEEQLLAITGYENALIFPSGMSAITTTFLSLMKEGDTLLASNRLYGDTLKFFIEELPRLGVKVHFFDINDIDAISEKKGNFLYFETMSNPDLVVADLAKIKALAQRLGALSICDATFTPPGNIKFFLPDLVNLCIHSLTKYSSGHFASTGGALLTSSDLAKKVWHTQALYGACMDPQAAWQVSQGLKTLSLRIEKQNQSALSLANFLANHPAVHAVYYPFCSFSPQFSLATSQFYGGGGVVSFSLKKGKEAAIALLERVKLIGLYVSLGGVQSCIEHAQSMSHSMVTSEHRRAAYEDNAPADLLRLSVGIENLHDLMTDLEKSLNSMTHILEKEKSDARRSR